MNKMLFWNCRGLGSPSLVNSLFSLVRKFSLELLFLSETKGTSFDIKKVQHKLQFDKCFCVEAVGRSGGLGIFWNNDIEVRILGSGEHYIDVHIMCLEGRKWRLTCIYGWPKHGQKFRTWEMINNLGRDNDDPWLLEGDFNEILVEAEKRGGLVCDFNNLSDFRDCLDNNGLADLGSMGHPFTWSDKRTSGFIEERLDRFVATERWRNLFTMATVENITWDSSDHCPIALHLGGLEEDGSNDRRHRDRLFRFEARWTYHEGFDHSTGSFWELSKRKHGPFWSSVIEECSSHLQKWNKEVYMVNYSKPGWLLRRLKKFCKMPPSPIVIEEYRRVEQEIRTLPRNSCLAEMSSFYD